MNIKKISLTCVVLFAFIGLMGDNARAQLPDDFPELTINQYGETAPGCVYGKFKSNNPEVGEYFMILENSGTPVFYSTTENLGEPVCNGLFKYAQRIAGLNKKFTWRLQDDGFNDVDTFAAGNGYHADNHDFQILPNGHALVLIYDKQVVDMSKIVAGGHPAASINGSVIQELDVNKNVIFQWRSWDHIPITDSYQDHTKAGFDSIHVNSMELDVTDGNLILSCRSTSDVIKISRVTGEVMWRLCGKENEFTFINEREENAPRYFKYQHDARRYANGNLSLFDNGFNKNDSTREYSRAVEYHLDEENMTATMVWEYRNDPDFSALSKGQAIRLDNGNTVIHWGNAAVRGDAPAMSEVDPSGQLVYELWPAQEDVTVDTPTGQFDRIVWPLADQATKVTHYELLEGNYYPPEGEDDETGVRLKIDTVDEGYNEVYVTREPFAPLKPMFTGKAPRVLPIRLHIDGLAIDTIDAEMSLDAESFGFANATGPFGYADPAEMTIYHRSSKGIGVFTPLETNYNTTTKQLRATMTQFGEFIIGFPDLEEIPYPPIMLEPAAQASVNHQLPVSFLWTPRGFARSYQLQIAADSQFETLVADESYLTGTSYVLDTVDPDTTYYYRIKTANDGGLSDWAEGSFVTVPPMIQATAPADGEALNRGLDYFIKWDDNIGEDVVIELYKGAAPVLTVGTVPSDRVFEWEVDLGLEPGIGYSFKISSSTDPILFSVSGSFSIDVPLGDLNGDGKVDLADLAILADNYLDGVP